MSYVKEGPIRFYLSSLGWELNEQLIPSGSHRLVPNEDFTEAQIKGLMNNQELVSMRPIENYLKETSVPYADWDELKTETASFFVNASGGGITITGSVPTYGDLPNAAISMNQLWYVETGSGGYLSLLGIYKYPRGLYWVNESTVWELIPLNVKASEDTTTIINIDNWVEFYNYSFDVNIGDRLYFNNYLFVNLTGNYTSTTPDADPTNWTSYVDLAPQISVAYREGRQFYDSTYKAFSYYTDVSTISAIRQGRVLRTRATNNELTDLVVGDVVKIVSVSGVLPVVEGSQSNNILSVKTTIGMVMHTITPTNPGYLAIYDTVVGVDTSEMQVNDLIYLSPDTKGKFTNIEPKAPNYSLAFGFVAVVGGAGAGAVSVRFGGFTGSDTSVNIEGISNGTATLEQSITFVDDGVNIYADIINNEEPTDNLPVMFDDMRYLLDTTTGSGAGGAARVQLLPGTATQPQGQFIYIYLNGGVPTLAVSINFPLVDHAQLAIVSLKNITTFQSEGVQVYQRTNNSPNGSVTGGLLRVFADKLRFIGALQVDGVEPTIIIDTGPSPDSVNITTIAGNVFQLRLQSFGATTGIEYWILNHPTTGITRITDLNQIDVDAQGNTLLSNGIRYGLTFLAGQNSENVTDKIYINLPNGSYGDDLDCINDVNNYQVTSVPINIGLRTTAFRLCRGCFRRNITNGGTYINILETNGLGNYQDERGHPLGAGGGGSGSTSIDSPFPPDYLTKLNVDQASTTTVTIQPGNCRDSTNSTNIISESVIIVDITVVGFNGRDTGSVMNFVWTIFIISDSEGVNPVGGLFSLSETAPLLPSGYDSFRRVGSVKRRSSELLKFSSIGGGLDKTIMYDIAGDALQILSGGSATSFALVGTGDFVPPTAKGVYLQLGFIADVNGDAMLIRVGGGIGTGISDFFRTGGSHPPSMAMAVFMNLDDEQKLEYKVDDPADLAFLNIRGYVDDLSSN